MRSGLSLKIILRVPVTVEDHNSISSSKVDSNATSFRRQKHHKHIGIRRAISIDSTLPLLAGNGSVDSIVAELSQDKVVFYNVEHDTELTENQDSVALTVSVFVCLFV